MARRGPRRHRLALPSRGNNKRRPTGSSRVRDSSFPKRRQGLRCLSARETHSYNTNLPLITSAYRIFFGGKTPFTATVIYVSTKQFAGKWGAKAQTTELAPLMVHGTAWLRVTDPNLFVNEVVGGQGAYATSQVDDFIRGFINERVIDEMSRYDLQTAFTQLDKASVTVKVNIN